MSKSSYRNPLYIAVGLKALAMSITWGLIANSSITQGYRIPAGLPNQIIPPTGIRSILDLLIYATFLGIVLKYRGERRRLISGIIIAVYICYGLGSGLLSSVWTTLVANRRGAEYLGASSYLSAVISQSTVIFNGVAAALFYVSLGRYGVSYNMEDGESPAPQYQNYQP